MANYQVGEGCVLGENVEIGEGCVIGNHVTIHAGSRIGENVRVDANVVIGKQPMKAVTSATTDTSGKLEGAVIGNGCIIGTNAVIYAGAKIGNDCLVADFASVREDVTIGEKTIVGCRATIENKVTVGSYCKIQSGVSLVPYTVVEDHVFLAPWVTTANDAFAGRTEKRKELYAGPTIRKGARIGLSAKLLPGVEIGEDAFVGAGSLVTKDIPPRKVVYGVPAKIIRDVPKEELLENQK